ncbi:MAG: hypothetical protein K0U98_14370 [Deltaproteobacteria bacterium]|nr:hypothetical protein [Deltaproteobacteria bacterium]
MTHAMLKSRLKATPAYFLFRRWQAHWELFSWNRSWAKGKATEAPAFATPPRLFKQLLVSRYAAIYDSATFIETGTFLGDMVYAQRRHFHRLFSIEIDEPLHRRVQRRFSRLSNIHLLHGDSGSLLPTVLPSLQEPCLFWLDAHAMGSAQQRLYPKPPILRELEAILSSDLQDCVVLIDDARLFFEGSPFPSIEKVKETVHHYRPDWQCEVRDDVIRVHRAMEITTPSSSPAAPLNRPRCD